MAKWIRVDGKRFVDSEGRHTILHGINMVCKKPEKGYLEYVPADFTYLKKLGFHVVRLGVFWDGLEPEPSKINTNYLDRIEATVDMAAKEGICVFLDMHQDLFGGPFSPPGDGAPNWAALTDNQPHYPTELWSEAYLISPAVQHAFDNFWANTPAKDGTGLQDHYVLVWQAIAKRFAKKPNVIGYDLMNEPFMGSSAEQLMGYLLMNLSPFLFPGEEPDMEKLQALWLDPTQKEGLMARLTEREVFEPVIRGTQDVARQFEVTVLQPFYQKISNAIRAIDTETAIFLETNYFSNMGMKCAVQPLTLADGSVDSQQVYAPHGYDLLVDTELYDQANNNRVELIFDTHKEVHDEIGIPMLVGEWGCFPGCKDSQLPGAAYITDLFEQYLVSDTYFDFEHVRGNKILQVIQRAYPMHVAGELKAYHYDYKTGAFDATFLAKCGESAPSGRSAKCGDKVARTGESLFYIPLFTDVTKIVVSPAGATYTVQKLEGCDAAIVTVVTKKEGEYVLKVR